MKSLEKASVLSFDRKLKQKNTILPFSGFSFFSIEVSLNNSKVVFVSSYVILIKGTCRKINE